jgi:hypothetical protein
MIHIFLEKRMVMPFVLRFSARIGNHFLHSPRPVSVFFSAENDCPFAAGSFRWSFTLLCGIRILLGIPVSSSDALDSSYTSQE